MDAPRLLFEILSKGNLPEALSIAKASFPDDFEDARDTLIAFLDPTHPKHAKRRMLKHWLGTEIVSDKKVALTGVYNRTDEHNPDEAWLAWYCVDPSARGRGFGRETLVWTIDEVRKLGYKKFRLWTTASPIEAAAQVLYESMGLKIYKEEDNPKQKYKVYYREMSL